MTQPMRALSDEILESYRHKFETMHQKQRLLFPGEYMARQPVHTVYGGAQLFRKDTVQKLGVTARKFFSEYAGTAQILQSSLNFQASAELVYDRVNAKLTREPVEDFRIDFEDGYGIRGSEEEDSDALRTADELATAINSGIMSPFSGIRIKSLSGEQALRAIRTLDLFVCRLSSAMGNRIPENFVITLPKITSPEQISILVECCRRIEKKMKLSEGTLRIELMIEAPLSIFDSKGRTAIPDFIEACHGRCAGLHFGTYDYTASCGITAEYQRMDHPSCDFAKHIMQISAAGRGIPISDGATNILPIPTHRPKDESEVLSPQQLKENQQAVHRAWKLAYSHIRHSLSGAFYQGWDLHPAQIPVRYTAVYSFFHEGLQQAQTRLSNFVDKAAKATLVGEVFDDAATGQGLLNFFARAVNCGAISENELQKAGVTMEEVRKKSFLAIVAARTKNLK